MLRYAITKRQVYVLGGVDRFDAMTEDARRVLVNLVLLRGRKHRPRA
jgi:hypothetical protein